MYWRYSLLVIADLLAGIINLILAPVVVCFANTAGWLPRWLWWFQTPGDSLFGSVGWQTKDRWFRAEDTAWKIWFNKVGWLYRNSTYGFAIDVLGAQAKPGDTLEVTGRKETSNHKPITPGWVHYVLLREGKPVYFQFYIVAPWLFGLYFRGNFGWKLWSYSTTEKMQLTFSPNPFRKV